MNYLWSLVSEKKIVHELAKMHKITNYSIKIRGCPHFTNLEGIHPIRSNCKYRSQQPNLNKLETRAPRDSPNQI